MTGTFLIRVLPGVLALMFHGVALVAFLWASAQDRREFQFEEPVTITAELIVMEARPQPAPPQPIAMPQPAPAKPLPVAPEPEEEPPPPPEPEPEPEPPPPEPAFDEDRLLDEALDLAIAAESAEFEANELDEVALSYHMGIYQRIVNNWSRPVSARNGMRADLLVHLIPSGDVANVTLVQSSGDTAFDRSAEQAVRRAGRFEVPTDQELFETHFRALPVTFSPQDLLR